jgi:glucokinase
MALLVGDIGGTNARFGIYDHGLKKVRSMCTPCSSDFISLLKEYLTSVSATQCCLAVAGPVVRNRVEMTNADLVVDAHEIMRRTGLKDVVLLNDFASLGFGVNLLRDRDVHVIQKGVQVRHGTKAVMGAGTGLGKSILTYSSGRYVPLASEGGHADLVLDHSKIRAFLMKRKKRELVYEDVLSGKGLSLIFEFFSGKKVDASEVFSFRKSAAGKKTVALFVSVYARACRNFALETLCTGGLYLAGGIAVKHPWLFGADFKKEFRRGPLQKTLRSIPIYLIRNEHVGLLGASVAYSHFR